mgnify:CR=1 FL=1
MALSGVHGGVCGGPGEAEEGSNGSFTSNAPCLVTEWLATLFPDMSEATKELKNCEISTLSRHDLEVRGMG